MLCVVDYIFNLLCAVKTFVFSVVSRATGSLQMKPSGSGDENVAATARVIWLCARVK